MIKTNFFIFYLLFFIISGCVTSPYTKQGDQYYQSQNYTQALRNYQLALSQTREGNARLDIEEKIRLTKENLVRMHISKADTFAKSENPDKISAIQKAIEILQEAKQWESPLQEVQESVSRYNVIINDLKTEKKSLLQQTFEHISDYDFASALNLIQKAAQIDSKDSEIELIIQAILAMHEAGQNMETSILNNQINDALAEFQKMNLISPVELNFSTYPNYEQIIKQVRQNAERMEMGNRWYEAYILLSSLNLSEFSTDIQRIRYSGSRYYFEKSTTAIQDHEDYFRAYLLSVMASTLDNNDISIFRRLQQAETVVRNSIQNYIAVATFDSPSNDPDAGRQFSDSLISHLYSVLPYGINILERDKIDFVLQEQQADNRLTGQMLGVDLMVSGSVSLFRVDTNIDKRNATAKVKVGEESVPNPEYHQMVAAHGPDAKRWPSVPPMMIARDRVEILNYTRGTAETRGFAKVSVRIFDTDMGAISFVKDFDANVAYDIDFQDEVKMASIEYIPLRLPSETEVKEQMRREIVGKVAQVVQASFESREHRFLNQAKFYLERREPQLAIKPIAQAYYYCIADEIPLNNPAFDEIRKLMPRLME